MDFVQAEAKKLGFFFLLDCEEGREMPDLPEDMDVEDLSGWLLTPEQEANSPHRTEIFEPFGDPAYHYIMARWDVDENKNLIVRFED